MIGQLPIFFEREVCLSIYVLLIFQIEQNIHNLLNIESVFEVTNIILCVYMWLREREREEERERERERERCSCNT